MKIQFKREDILNAVNTVQRAVPSKTTMSILECILISCEHDKVRFTANDLELAIETEISADKCKIMETGAVAVEARVFGDIIRKIASENNSDILMESDGSIVQISCDYSLFKIQERDPDQFPALPELRKNVYMQMSQYILREVIKDTIFSVAVNDTNKMMTGELFELKGDHLRVVSLDGHRIAIRNVQLKENFGTAKAIIPGKSLNELSKILTGEADKNVDIFLEDNYAMFRFEDTVMTVRLIDGEYFRIDQMLSNDYELKAEVNRKEFIENIECAVILIRESDKKPLILNITDNKMDMKLNSVVGSLDSSLLINKSGKDLMIAFNPKYLLDALRVIEDENVSLYMTNAKAPCFIRDEEGKYIYLILPVNFSAGSY